MNLKFKDVEVEKQLVTRCTDELVKNSIQPILPANTVGETTGRWLNYE